MKTTGTPPSTPPRVAPPSIETDGAAGVGPNLLVRSPTRAPQSPEALKRASTSPIAQEAGNVTHHVQEHPVDSPDVEGCTMHPACMPAMPELIDMMRNFLPWNPDRSFSFGLTLGDGADTGDKEKMADACAFLLTAHSLSYSAVSARPELLDGCVRAIREAVACIEGVGLRPDIVELLGGASYLQAAVVLPSAAAREVLRKRGGPQAKLEKIAPALCRVVAARLAAIEGIEAALVSGQSLLVTEPGVPLVAPNIVRFQGSWTKERTPEKDAGMYVIRNNAVCFPSGGRAELTPIGPYSFSIAHPSGAVFEASLEANGQELKWTNGSLWLRATEAEAIEARKNAPALGADSSQALALRMQVDEGREVGPMRWGITAAQCKELLQDLRSDPAWKPCNTVETLISDFLVERTQGTGAGYALRANAGAPKEANVLLVHARGRAANAEELLQAAALSAKSSKDAFWIDALSLYHAEDDAASEKVSDHAYAAEVLERLGARTASGYRRCRRFSGALLRALPAALSALAVALFYEPALAWGCMPAADLSRCAVRLPAEDNDWSQGVEWSWSPRYEADLDGASAESELLQRCSYVAAACCAGLAFLAWVLNLTRPDLFGRGRMLVVMGPGDTASALGDGAAAAVIDAKRLRVPIAVAGGVTGAAAAARKAEYTISVSMREDARLGMEVVTQSNALYVASLSGGLVEEWNQANPDKQVRPEDRLVEVNGIRRNVKKIQEECAKQKELKLTFRQAPTCRAGHPLRPLEAPSQGICDGCGMTVEPGVQVVDCSECDYFLCALCHEQSMGRRFEEKSKASTAGRAEGPLREVARWRLMAESAAVVRWAAAFWVIRTADVALSLADGSSLWRWDTVAPACALGTLVGAVLTTFVVECAAQRSAQRAGAAGAAGAFGCALLLLAAGGGMVALLALMGGLKSNSQLQRWPGAMEWLGDEALRHMDLQVCNTLMRQRVIAFAATCGQTLVIGSANLALFTAGSLCCHSAVRRRPWAAAATISVLLVAATAIRFAAPVLASGELPESEFMFAAVAFLVTQTAARCGIPLLALCAAVSRRGMALCLWL